MTTPADTAPLLQPAIARILLLIAYDGTAYSGFALQNNAPTICGELRKALLEIDPDIGPLTGSSRTDAGVHARNQPVSFLTKKTIRSRGWVLALNQRLPAAIRVNYAAQVGLDFDPRRAPLWKRYCYRIYNAQTDDPFISRVSWRVGQSLDVSLMQKEAQHLLGKHDFRAFRSADDVRVDTVRDIFELSITANLIVRGQIELTVTGNRFMYNMVRIIAGSLVDVGRGKLACGSLERALASGDRTHLGVTAPARGLMLEHVELPSWGDSAWPERLPSGSGA